MLSTTNFNGCSNSRLKTIYIIGQKKAFCRQGILEFTCGRKKNPVDIHILTTSRIDDRKIMLPIRIQADLPGD